MQSIPRAGERIPVAGPALVLVVGRGADRAVRRAFARDELLPAGADPTPRLRDGLLTAAVLEEPDPERVDDLLAAAQRHDRAVDAILVGDGADLPLGRFRRVVRAGSRFVVDRSPAASDLRHRTGPFDVVGDVHGCLEELLLLLARLGYEVRLDLVGRPAGARHPEGRTLVLTGDLVDRGPDVPGVLRLVLGMLASGDALAVLGNHDDALRRALLGHEVEAVAGLDASLTQLAAEPATFRAAVLAVLGALPDHLQLDGGALVVAHAGLDERYHGHESGRVRSLCLHGPTSGEADADGQPVRLRWADGYRGAATVVYGHTPTADRSWRNGTVCVDGGCVFGGALVALRYPEGRFVEVPAVAQHSAPARPFLPAG